MHFDRLNIRLLQNLKKSGYNILTSNNRSDHEAVYWFPEKVDNVNDYLSGRHGTKVSNLEPTILIIDEALENMEQQYLYGYVFCMKWN
ncbi:hypothetical protein IP023_14870 [Sphingobacterium rhinopitheci]|mgnify:CR=1 FL=1|nr:hypothetical protein [Sphingobacterium rhinopitheci]